MVDNQYRMKDEQFVNNLFPYLNGIFLSFFFFIIYLHVYLYMEKLLNIKLIWLSLSYYINLGY